MEQAERYYPIGIKTFLELIRDVCWMEAPNDLNGGFKWSEWRLQTTQMEAPNEWIYGYKL